jgi:methionyl-tRNA synthetase
MPTPCPLYVTTPIYYVNDRPHLGHAYCTVLADAARRFQQLLGGPAYFVTGTDEHGTKVQQAADKRGVTPQQHCDELHRTFKDLWPRLLCEPDQFIRTTEPRHEVVVRRALQQLYDAGHLEAREFEGWYSTAAERFWTEKELKDGKCPESGLPVVRLREKNWFFRMSRFQQPLVDAIESGRLEILPLHRRNEVLGFLRQPLNDLCISRPKERLRWGVELPFDTGYVTYVWVDALLNYATAIQGLQAEPPPPEFAPAPPLAAQSPWDAWWPHATHLIGKDILTTHAVYWPTLLMALGLPPPRRIVAHGWWLMADTKMSKSLGNVVEPGRLAEAYGPEVLRWFLLREMPVGQDASFDEQALLRRNASDLANDIGNLLQRTVALCARHFDGKVPEPPPDRAPSPVLREALAFRDAILGEGTVPLAGVEVESVPHAIERWKLHLACQHAHGLAQRLNSVLTHDAPFKAIHTDRPAAALTLYHVLDSLRVVGRLLEPALPLAGREMLRRVGLDPGDGPLPTLQELRRTRLPPGAAVVEGAPLFPRLELRTDALHEQVTDRLPQEFAAPPPVHAKVPVRKVPAERPEPPLDPARTGEFPAEGPAPMPAIEIDTFGRVELRVVTVRSAEAVPKSTKLLRLIVDDGTPVPRQILAGVAETVAPESLVDQQVLIVANLPSRKMMGLQSHGMLLVAEDADGKRVPLSPQRAVPNGAQVK